MFHVPASALMYAFAVDAPSPLFAVWNTPPLFIPSCDTLYVAMYPGIAIVRSLAALIEFAPFVSNVTQFCGVGIIAVAIFIVIRMIIIRTSIFCLGIVRILFHPTSFLFLE